MKALCAALSGFVAALTQFLTTEAERLLEDRAAAYGEAYQDGYRAAMRDSGLMPEGWDDAP